MKFNSADLKQKLHQQDKETLVCKISATGVSDRFHLPQNIHCSISCTSIRKFAEPFLLTTDPVLFRNLSPCPFPASSTPTISPKIEIKRM